MSATGERPPMVRPFKILPLELAASIFVASVEATALPLIIAAVSRGWRHEVFRTAILWSQTVVERLVLDFGRRPGSHDADIVGSLVVWVTACLPIDGPMTHEDMSWACRMLTWLRQRSASYSASPDIHSQPAAFYFPSWPHDVFDPTRTAEACATYRRDVLAYELARMLETTMGHLMKQLNVDPVLVRDAHELMCMALLLLRPGDNTKHTEALLPLVLEQWSSSVGVASCAKGWLVAVDSYPRARILSLYAATDDVVFMLNQTNPASPNAVLGQMASIQVLVEHLLRADAEANYTAVVQQLSYGFSALLQKCGGRLPVLRPGQSQPLLASVMMLVRVMLVVSNFSIDDLGLAPLLSDILLHFGPQSSFSTNLCFHTYHELQDPLRLLASALLLTPGSMPNWVRELAAVAVLDSLLVRRCSPLYGCQDWTTNYEGVLTLCQAVQADATPFCPHLAAVAMPMLEAAGRAILGTLTGISQSPYDTRMGFGYFMSNWNLQLPPTDGRHEVTKTLWRQESRLWATKLRMRFLLFASSRQQSLDTLLAEQVTLAQAAAFTSARELEELGAAFPCLPRPCMRRCSHCRA